MTHRYILNGLTALVRLAEGIIRDVDFTQIAAVARFRNLAARGRDGIGRLAVKFLVASSKCFQRRAVNRLDRRQRLGDGWNVCELF